MTTCGWRDSAHGRPVRRCAASRVALGNFVLAGHCIAIGFSRIERDCRLMAPFAAQLVATAPSWVKAIAPVSEWVAATLRQEQSSRSRDISIQPTHLTQRRRREAKGLIATTSVTPPTTPRLCWGCGVPRGARRGNFCTACACGVSREAMLKIAEKGRLTASSPENNARRADALRRNRAAERAWSASQPGTWPTARDYTERIQPALRAFKISAVMSALVVSKPYGSAVRAGRKRPHWRHWVSLARLVGIGESNESL